MLVFIIYLNMMSAAKSWVEQGSISPALGIWWVHGVVLLMLITILAVQNGYHRRVFS
jgi:lipopolysaccharide export system permease protein